MKSEPSISRRYSRLEIAFISVLVLLIGTLAVTKYLEISVDVKEAMEPGLIAGIREGLSEYAEDAKARGSRSLYPPVLDYANLGNATQRNLFFDRVLEKGVAVAGWSKTGANEYRTPSGKTIVYHPDSGQFASPHQSESAPPAGATSPGPEARE